MIKILLLLVLVVVIFFMFDLKENFDVTGNIFTQKSNEAIQNIAKIYADASGTVMFNNVNATGMINGDVTGNVTGDVTGNVTGNLTGNLTGDISGNTNILGSLKVTGEIDNPATYRWKYLGCYKDSIPRTLPIQAPLSVSAGSECKDYALINGFMYAGIQFGGQCFVGNDDPTKLGKVNGCPYNGGAMTNQVYKWTNEP
jgi:outer membrane lipoprotein SlyB